MSYTAKEIFDAFIREQERVSVFRRLIDDQIYKPLARRTIRFMTIELQRQERIRRRRRRARRRR